MVSFLDRAPTVSSERRIPLSRPKKYIGAPNEASNRPFCGLNKHSLGGGVVGVRAVFFLDRAPTVSSDRIHIRSVTQDASGAFRNREGGFSAILKIRPYRLKLVHYTAIIFIFLWI